MFNKKTFTFLLKHAWRRHENPGDLQRSPLLYIKANVCYTISGFFACKLHFFHQVTCWKWTVHKYDIYYNLPIRQGISYDCWEGHRHAGRGSHPLGRCRGHRRSTALVTATKHAMTWSGVLSMKHTHTHCCFLQDCTARHTSRCSLWKWTWKHRRSPPTYAAGSSVPWKSTCHILCADIIRWRHVEWAGIPPANQAAKLPNYCPFSGKRVKRFSSSRCKTRQIMMHLRNVSLQNKAQWLELQPIPCRLCSNNVILRLKIKPLRLELGISFVVVVENEHLSTCKSIEHNKMTDGPHSVEMTKKTHAVGSNILSTLALAYTLATTTSSAKAFRR